MNSLVRNTLAAALAAVPMIALSADAPKLNVRMGLWETSFTVAGAANAMMAGVEGAMQNMTPEQKAQMAAAMSRLQHSDAAQSVRKSRSCMTPEKMQRDGFFNDKEMNGHCTHTVVENTATATSLTFSCAENGVTNEGKMRFEAPSPTVVKGTMDMNIIVHGKPANTHTEFQSTWISADCGSEK